MEAILEGQEVRNEGIKVGFGGLTWGLESGCKVLQIAKEMGPEVGHCPKMD
jgi:hypothetical protein